jgi:hypothetical protein
MPFVQAGVTDRLTLGGGTPLLFWEGQDSHVFWLTPKLQIVRGENTQLAIGAMQLIGVANANRAGIAYGVVTHGDTDAAVTLGAGVAYSGFDNATGVLMLGAEKRINRSVKALSEAYYVWGQDAGVFMVGFRFFGKRLSADLGLAAPVLTEGWVVLPVVNFVWTF